MVDAYSSADDDMLEVKAHLPTGYHAGLISCQLCSYQWSAMWPEGARGTSFECPHCGAKAGMPDPIFNTERIQ